MLCLRLKAILSIEVGSAQRNGVEVCALSPSKYVSETVKNVEMYLDKEYGGMKLANQASSPFPCGYMPELDIGPELGPKEVQY